MQVLVATPDTQGHRPSDFCHVPADEPVSFVFECDRDRDRLDGPCGCRRSMGGLLAGGATTTMRVIDDPTMTPERLTALVREHYVRGGWVKVLGDADLNALVAEEVPELCRMAASFPIGAVVEKRGDVFRERTAPPTGGAA